MRCTCTESGRLLRRCCSSWRHGRGERAPTATLRQPLPSPVVGDPRHGDRLPKPFCAAADEPGRWWCWAAAGRVGCLCTTKNSTTCALRSRRQPHQLAGVPDRRDGPGPLAACRTDSHAADDAGARHGRVDDGDDIAELALEDAVKVFRAAERHEAVAVGQPRKDADLVAVLKLCACVVVPVRPSRRPPRQSGPSAVLPCATRALHVRTAIWTSDSSGRSPRAPHTVTLDRRS